MGHFPFEWHSHDLRSEDFLYFKRQFSETVLRLMPFAEGPVTTIGLTGDTEESLQQSNKPKYWLKYVKRVLRQQRSVLAKEQPVLFLPVWYIDDIIGVVAVESIEKQFVNVLSEEWLSDRSRILSREFYLLKQAAIEPVTGMFNGQHLQETLAGLLEDMQIGRTKASTKSELETANKNLSIFMIEIHPRAQNTEKALHYIARAGYFLESFLGQHILHHLGNGVFGLINDSLDEEPAKILGKNILSWFRREGFSRIHIGINTVESPPEGRLIEPGDVLEQTWAALRKASRRGPYALCTFSSISNPDTHPLKKPKPSVMSRFRKLWADTDQFAVLIISQDRELPEHDFSKRILSLLEAGGIVVSFSETETYVFMEGADAMGAQSWARNLKRKMTPDLGASYSIGIAFYPCADFKKTDIPHNCRKALLHGGFFGPDTVTVFDGVSQNVSGDIYYGEGDLVRAVKEYKMGLKLDPKNTNLLNSLGEAYARMNNPRKARPYFEKIVRADKQNYMGLFNLGITYLTTGEDEQAINYFEKTLSASKQKPGVNQKNDLLMQLSKLYCRTGKYSKAVKLLGKKKILNEKYNNVPGRNALLRYLGEAYLGVGKNNKAIDVLQKAVRYNPHDVYSLSMLGELYAVEEQGDEIALSLCEQAVNIDDRHWKHWYRLALVRSKMEQYGPALDALKECLNRERKSIEALCLAGQIYDKMEMRSRSIKMYEKVLKIAPGHKAATKALKRAQ